MSKRTFADDLVDIALAPTIIYPLFKQASGE